MGPYLHDYTLLCQEHPEHRLNKLQRMLWGQETHSKHRTHVAHVCTLGVCAGVKSKAWHGKAQVPALCKCPKGRVQVAMPLHATAFSLGSSGPHSVRHSVRAFTLKKRPGNPTTLVIPPGDCIGNASPFTYFCMEPGAEDSVQHLWGCYLKTGGTASPTGGKRVVGQRGWGAGWVQRWWL